MFAKTVIDSDSFLDMPLTSQALYFHLAMRADDDGFVNSPKRIQRAIGSSDDDMRLLIAKNFIIPFNSGVVVIAHWRIHNYIRKDTYNETPYREEKALLKLKENKLYFLTGLTSSTDSARAVDEPLTQYSIGKDRLGKVRLDKESIEKEIVNTPQAVHHPLFFEPQNEPQSGLQREEDDESIMTIRYFFTRYLIKTGQKHDPISAEKMEEIKRRFDETGVYRDYVDVYFGDEDHKGLCGDSDCKIFHFASPGVLEVIKKRLT